MKVRRDAAAIWLTATRKARTRYVAGLMNPRARIVPVRPRIACLAAGIRYQRMLKNGLRAYRKAAAHNRRILERVILPPRMPKGNPHNIARCFVVCAALHQDKVARRRAKGLRGCPLNDCNLCKCTVPRLVVR